MGQPNPHYEVIHSGKHDATWLDLRRLGVGASESPVLPGLSTFRSPSDIYADKLGIADAFDENEHMIIGQMAERTVLKIFERLSGHTVASDQRLLRSKKWPWLQATPDGAIITTDLDNPISEVIEAKVTSIPWPDGAPKYVWGQIQHQMAVMGLDKGCAVALHGSTLPWTHIERDNDYIDNVHGARRRPLALHYLLLERDCCQRVRRHRSQQRGDCLRDGPHCDDSSSRRR